jgi:hypothetical protein
MRRIIEVMIQANVNDAVINQATDYEAASLLIKKQACHVVIASWESSDVSAVEFFQGLQGNSPLQQRIPIVALVTKEHAVNLEKVNGVEQVRMPCSAEELAEAINRACNPVRMRQSKRYSLPDTTAILEQGTSQVEAVVINVSSGGLLCELDYPGHFSCAMPVMVSIIFHLQGEELSAVGLFSAFTGMQVIARNSDHSPKRIRLSFYFITVPQEAAGILAHVFVHVEQQEQGLQA